MSGTMSKWHSKVSGMTLTIEDFEGMPIQKTIGDVKVVYKLNEANTSAYGYTTDKTNVTVSGSGSLRRGSKTVYDISEMNFQNAGMYDSCSISFSMDNLPVGAGDSYIAIKYKDGEAVSTSAFPRFEVKWYAPDVTFISTNPAVGTSFDVAVAGSGGSYTVEKKQNIIEENGHKCTVYVKYARGCFGAPDWTLSKATAKLNGAGSNYTKATIVFPNKSDSNYPVTYTFTPTRQTNEQTVSYATTSRVCIGAPVKTQVEMEYNGAVYTVTLAIPVTLINEK